MPYRRLPNTDKARLRAMKTALKKQENELEMIIPFDFRTKLQDVCKDFGNKLLFKTTTLQNSSKLNKKHTATASKTRMYLSHFLQVINMSIQRGELNSEVFIFYGLKTENSKLPDMSNDELLQKWGEQIIKGENQRMLKGGNRIFNPSIALVSINFEKFKESYRDVKMQHDIQLRANTDLANYREIADRYILQLWNVLEKHFEQYSEERARAICSEWGISYVYRKEEIEKIKQQKYAESISLSFDFNA